MKKTFLAFTLLLAQFGTVAAAPVTSVSINNTITAYTRTSGSGVLPMTWQISFSGNVHEGYFLHAYIYSDCTKVTLVKEARHYLTHADLQPGATISFANDGLGSIGATQCLEFWVEKTTPNGLGYAYQYPTALSPTDTPVTMTWNAADKDNSVTLSGSNLIATWNGTGSNYAGVRTNRSITPTKAYWEVIVNNVSARTRVGVASSTAPISLTWSPSQDGGATTNQAAVRYGGACEYDTSGALACAPSLANGDRVGIATDSSAKKIWWRVNNGSWLPTGDPATGTGGLSISAMNTPYYPAAQVSFGGQVTAVFSSFTDTPPSGFTQP